MHEYNEVGCITYPGHATDMFRKNFFFNFYRDWLLHNLNHELLRTCTDTMKFVMPHVQCMLLAYLEKKSSLISNKEKDNITW